MFVEQLEETHTYVSWHKHCKKKEILDLQIAHCTMKKCNMPGSRCIRGGSTQEQRKDFSERRRDNSVWGTTPIRQLDGTHQHTGQPPPCPQAHQHSCLVSSEIQNLRKWGLQLRPCFSSSVPDCRYLRMSWMRFSAS